MRQTLVAITCLSVLAFAQNVLAIAPTPADAAVVQQAAIGGVSAAMPPTGSMALLLMGLVGLTVAGRRIEERAEA